MASDQQSIAARTPAGDFVCTGCASPLIQPLDWERTGEDEWRLLFRCPECFEPGAIRFTDIQAGQFQNLLDEATRTLEDFADLLDRQGFQESCDSFARALRADLICPMDF
jgi:hypothetical protein